MRVKRSPKIVSIRLKWQISSFIDHLPGTLRVASAASSRPGRQPLHLGRLRAQALDQRQMHRVFVAVIVMMMLAHAGHYRMCHRRVYEA